MPGFSAKEIGKIYDLGLATRDGQPLTVLNKDGQPVNVSQVAYVLVNDPNEKFQEAIALQRKDQLVRLSSANVSDREFDQNPQSTQADWSGGMLQRVYTEADRYWDGLGLIWPQSDYLPQEPALVTYPDNAADATQSQFFCAAGSIGGGSSGLIGYAFTYLSAGHFITVFITGENNPPTRWSGSDLGNNQPIGDMFFGHGQLWQVKNNGAGGVGLYQIGVGVSPALVGAKLLDLVTDTTIPQPGGSAGNVGNRQYIAATVRYNSGNFYRDRIRLVDVTSSTVGTYGSAVVDVPLPNGWNFVQSRFLGDDLIISITDGMNAEIFAYNIANATVRTLAQIDGGGSIRFTVVGGTLFLVASQPLSGSGTNAVKQMDMYLLQGSSLQYIGPVIRAQSTFWAGGGAPVSFGPYALFTASYAVPAQGPNQIGYFSLFAYDVLRGRLFKAMTIGMGASAGALNWILTTPTIAAVSTQYFGEAPTAGNPAGGTIAQAQWMVVVNTSSSSGINQGEVREFLVGLGDPIVQQACDITSSIIDFTLGASNKLYQGILASHDPITVNGQSVTLSAWLDQDPNNLAAVPDFTVTHTFSAQDSMPKQTLLVINKIARKLVYRITTAPPSFLFQVVPKLVSVAVRAGTGWVWSGLFDLTRAAQTNAVGTQDTPWQRQGIDNVVAYNFMRQLWRQKLGQCTAYLPNGDSFPALIQVEEYESAKPLSGGTRADQQLLYEVLVRVRIREDV